MRIRYSTIFRTIAIAFFVLVISGAQFLFSQSAGFDAATVSQLANEGEFDGGSYALVSLIYSLTPERLILPIILVIGSFFLYYCTRRITTNIHAILVFFLCISPAILTVATFQKDLLLVPFIILSALSIEKIKSRNLIYIAVGAIYISYALMFRGYFAVIFATFLIISFFLSSNSLVRFIIVVCAIVALMLSPVDIFQKLQGSRDMVNAHRINQSGELGFRTAFINIMPINGAYSFIVNYIYSAVRLNLPILFYFGYREMFLFANVAFYFYFPIWGIIKGNRPAKISGIIVLSHIAVLNLFEPDLGSYSRHLSSTLPFLVLPIRQFFLEHGYSLKFRSTERIKLGNREQSART